MGVGEGQGHFQYQNTPRECFTMYPEEKLGVGLHSASIMWEHVEEIFVGIRDVMVKNCTARSGSFSLQWTAACMAFFEILA